VAGRALRRGVRAVLRAAPAAGADGQLLALQRVRADPGFTLHNYAAIFEGCGQRTDHGDLCVTLGTYLSTLKFCVLVWAITLCWALRWPISWPSTCAPGRADGLFVLCTVPFWTSNVIRMISWVPLLGRNGLVNQALQGWA
jgi:putative spermidine/putrescine transport system permease protein